MMKLKKILYVVFSVVLIVLLSFNIFAAVKPHDEINWTNIQSITCAVGFDDNGGEAIVSVLGKVGTESILVNLTIYKQRTDGTWTYVTQTVQSRSSRYFPCIYDFPATPGCTYKASATVTVITDGVSETANVYCESTFD